MLNHDNNYLIFVNQRLYQIEEVENRPFNVKVTCFIPSVDSVNTALAVVKGFNSLRNFILCQNRP